jgi:Family of unknown function (DUF6460)
VTSSFTHRIFGGSPVNVIIRLLFVSLVVGALMTWLDIHPHDVIAHAIMIAQRFWAMGFDAIREIGEYIIAGALIVVPLWLLARLMDLRTPR